MKSLIVLLILSISVVSFGQGIEFAEGTWKDILELAEKEDKPIMVDAYTTWCGPCKWMSKNTFTDSMVGALVNQNFIPYKMDMEKGEGVDFAKDNNVRAYPTILFFSPQGQLIHKSVGAKKADQFFELCEEALDPSRTLDGFKQRYDNGDRDKTFLKEYIKVLMSARENSDVVFDEYWGMLTEDEKISEDMFFLLRARTRGFDNYNNPLFTFFMDHKGEYETVVKEETIKYALFNAYHGNVYRVSKLDEKGEQKIAIESLKTLFPENSHEVKEFVYYTKARDLKDEKLLEKATKKYMKVTTSANMLNSAAWKIYEDSDKKSDLKRGLKWVTKSIEINEGYHNLDTKAALLFKLTKYDEAKLYIDKAFAKAEADELTIDLSASETLRDKIIEAIQHSN